jgi:NAD(P)-dependent dehydrogenase (short-subunit alcohol dehydrogenase family)
VFGVEGYTSIFMLWGRVSQYFVVLSYLLVCIYFGFRVSDLDGLAYHGWQSEQEIMKLNGKVACVTGSVRGIGWEIVQAYAQEGAKVVVCDLNQTDVDRALARLSLPVDNILGLRADVTAEEDVGFLFNAIKEKFGKLNILVNNAGFAWPREGPIDLEVADTPFQVWLKVLNTNLTGTFLCSREALRMMRAQRFGAMINISSPQGKLGRALRGPYCAAKFGVEGLTQVLSLENSSHNIRVNALDPGGIVATEAIRNIPGNKGKKMLSPEVVRPCAVYLASDESLEVTGRSLVASEWNKQHGIEVPYTIA